VVGTELTPYPKIFVPIDNKLGGLMGRVIGQKEIPTMNYVASDSIVIPFGCAICYESVYPEYCTGYVLKGAKFMTIITNDAWWGNTPGYKQHANYASLRAIELRRDIARCGNTGISGIINQRGEYLSTSNWWQRETLSGQVNTASRKTFFVRHGDLVGRISKFAFLLLFSYLIVSLLIRRRN
jgi:apolipoprotein N-acyltransferase